MSESSNKRIAKNTVVLYARMALSMIVSLYTSRIVLRELGAEDFGINNVVAGVVAMFSFINASMSGATSRFLTFELGKKNFEGLKKQFGAAKSIHLFVAILVVILAETVGMYFLNNKLVIPQGRLSAAYCVYQCCVVSVFFTITQVPYTASVFSHEKMTVYAYIEIAHTFLKFGSVFLLSFGRDKLILFGFLTMGISILVSFSYRIYCWVNFEESRTKFVLQRKLLKPMLVFSGWDLYGNLSVMARTQGVNMLLNMFFGPIMNAAAGIATSVQGAVMGLSGNLVTAMRPQIVKRYAAGEIASMFKLLDDVGKLAFLLISLLTIPLIVEIDYILSLWLIEPPKYAACICIYVLLFNVFAQQSVILVSVVHATGRIIRPSLINGTLYLLVVPVSYVSFKMGGAYWTSFLFNVIAVFCGMLSNAWTIHLYIREFSFQRYLISNLIPCILLFLIVLICMFEIRSLFDQGLLRLVMVLLGSTFLLCVVGFKLLISKDVREKIKEMVKRKICKNH